MDKSNRYQKLNDAYVKKINSLVKTNKTASEVYTQLSDGNNRYLKMNRIETSSYDTEWIEKIEDSILDLGQIIKNPWKTTKTQGNIVPVELARKTNSESIRHLSSHTQYVKSVDSRGNITPNKVLTIETVDNYATYENRFISTLIKRLVYFIEKRYEYIVSHAELKNLQVNYIKSKAIVDGNEVEIETKVTIKSDVDEKIIKQSEEYLTRVKKIREYLLYYFNSDFMKILKNEKDVTNPILQTNVIRKNPLYHKCYNLYKFIERYNNLGVNYSIDEKYTLLNEEERQEMNANLLSSFLSLKSKAPVKVKRRKHKVYKQKVLTNVDEDIYVFSPASNEPLEFIRIDEGYCKAMAKPDIMELPKNPTREQAEYLKEEYAKQRKAKKEEAARKALLKRKEKEAKDFEKSQKELIKYNKKVEEDLIRREQERKQKEIELTLLRARKEIKTTARHDKNIDPSTLNIQNEQLDVVQAEAPVTSNEETSAPETTNLEEVK